MVKLFLWFKDMDSSFRWNDNNSLFLSVSFLCKQESRKRKNVVTLKYKEDTIFI